MKAIKIRPNDMGAFHWQGRRTEIYHLPYHVRSKQSKYSDKRPANQRTLIDIFGYIHGYAGHGNKVMRKRWQAASDRFERHHMPYAWGRSTPRFVNEYTAHRWM